MSEADRELIDRWLDGDLPPDEEVGLASRLETDAEVVAYLARRAHLHSALRQVLQRTAMQQRALALAEPPPLSEPHDLAALPRARRWPTKASWAVAASLAAAVIGVSVLWLGKASASPSALVRQALQAHAARLDRCYRVEVRPEPEGRDRTRRRTAAPTETLLWTRGDRFWNDIRVGDQSAAWGRDPQGGVWFTLSPDAGARLEPDEVPEALASACELRSLEPESLLRSILADFHLRREPTTNPDTYLIHAEVKDGHTNSRYRSALLEMDAASHVLRRVELHRMHKGRSVATVTFTLVQSALNDDASYTLAGHLSPEAEVLDRQTGRGKRGQLVVEFLRLVRVRPATEPRTNAEP